MQSTRCIFLLSTCLLACVAQSSAAADRMRAGQWDGSWTGAGTTRPTSTCVTQDDVDAMNGDVRSVRAHLEKVIPASICKVTDLKVNGSQIVYTSLCTGMKENVITTNYHGDSFESVDSSGAKSEAKRVGACR